MEKTTVLTTSKLLSIIVMLLTGITTVIATMTNYLSVKDWGIVIIAISPFLLALRGYLKDHYGVI
jgi:hypothetical protein